jgi:hypothetical protein
MLPRVDFLSEAINIETVGDSGAFFWPHAALQQAVSSGLCTQLTSPPLFSLILHQSNSNISRCRLKYEPPVSKGFSLVALAFIYIFV